MKGSPAVDPGSVSKPGNPRRALSRADSALRQAGVAIGDKIRFDHPGDWVRTMGTAETVGFTLWRGTSSRHVDARCCCCLSA